MLELLLCSLVTVLPDYLIRRYRQGKRWGREITFFSVWYELRVGITACLILTVGLITLIFYYHPSTTNVSLFFRTVTVLPETGGRVEEVFVENNQLVEAGAPLFRVDDATQAAAVEAARQSVAEIEAQQSVAQSDLAAVRGAFDSAQGALNRTQTELDRTLALQARNPDVVNQRELDRLQGTVESQQGAVDAARAQIEAAQTRIDTLLPAQLARAQADLEAAQVALDKTTLYAGVAGRLEQFTLQPGDFVSPLLRPAGILVPADSGRYRIQAGFDQITAQVIRPGMVGEISCFSKPFTIIPVVVTAVQDVIAAGQIRPTDALLDIQDRARPGTLTVTMEPLYAGQLDGVPPGSACIANAYTSNHDRLTEGDLSLGAYVFLHVVDTVGLMHALILRIQTLLFPVQTLVLSGH
jgi:multidrug resistance efflux pump